MGFHYQILTRNEKPTWIHFSSLMKIICLWYFQNMCSTIVNLQQSISLEQVKYKTGFRVTNLLCGDFWKYYNQKINDQTRFRLSLQVHPDRQHEYPSCNSDVGKSCMLMRMLEGRFRSEHEPTLGV